MTTATRAGVSAACLECRCSYFSHYLSYGGPALDHDAYHRAERHCIRAQRACSQQHRATGDYAEAACCREATFWEKRVRA